MDNKWPSVPQIHTNFENAYSNPELIDQIMPELHTLVDDHIELCKLLQNLNGPMDLEQIANVLQLVHAELKTHFVAEEQVLFPLIANYLGGMDAGPVGIMMEEHRTIRALYTETINALEATFREAEQLAGKLTNLNQALLDHLGKEDTGIFLVASHRLSDEEKAKVVEELPRYRDI